MGAAEISRTVPLFLLGSDSTLPPWVRRGQSPPIVSAARKPKAHVHVGTLVAQTARGRGDDGTHLIQSRPTLLIRRGVILPETDLDRDANAEHDSNPLTTTPVGPRATGGKRCGVGAVIAAIPQAPALLLHTLDPLRRGQAEPRARNQARSTKFGIVHHKREALSAAAGDLVFG